jgi:hypothetical protein
MSKTIFLPIYNGIRAKNFFYTDTYRDLVKDRDIRLVIAIPSSKSGYYRKVFNEPNVIFEPLDITSEPWFGRLLAEMGFNMLNTKTIRFKQKLEYWRYKKWTRFMAKRAIHYLLGPFTFLRGVVRCMDRLVGVHPGVSALLDKYKPDLVLAPDIVFPLDRIFLRAAKRKGYFVVGMTRSWDNLTSKGVIQILPDVLILHTSRMKKQAVELVGMPEQRIAVTGPPDYDKYFQPLATSRGEFCRKLGIPLERKIVLFAPFYDEYTGSALIMLNILLGAVKNGRLPTDLHFLVRYRPATPEMSSTEIEASGNVTFTKPCEFYFPVNANVQAPTRDWEFSPDDNELMINSIAYSDIVITTYSTLAIDAAARDKPTIGVRFDADPKTPLKSRVTAIHDAHDHYGELEAAGGVRLVWSGDELIEAVKTYLEHPEYERAGRAKITKEQIEFCDGKNGSRAASVIQRFLYNN